eukprot:Gb_17523 [translate_table: standard]
MSKADITTCTNATIYANSSIFIRNLNKVLDDLVEKTSETGFNTSSYGRSPNVVYGLLQCRGDISQQECYNCSQYAKINIRQSCGNDVGGRGWFDNYCYLRYENYSFFSTLDRSGNSMRNPINVTNPNEFDYVVRSLLHNLSVKATAPANKGFAAGSTTDSLFRSIYGLVQCWRDISITNCQNCLSTAIEAMLRYAAGTQGGQGLLGSCIVRYETWSFFESPIPSSPPQPPAESPRTGTKRPPFRPSQIISKNRSKKLPIILGSVGGLLLALILLCLIGMRHKHKFSVFSKPISQRHAGEVHEDVSVSLLCQEPMMYNLENLQVATENFHQNNKLGEGGFGSVYKGIMSDGREIAVKKLSLRSAQGKREFINEVKLVANIRHRNLVKLVGCCTEGPERLLVYEYLPNKSLDTILFHPEKREQLNWQKRYNIILGVARGLLYLHEDSELRIIHRDIKANNILLDDKLNPKIADFGLARLFPQDETHVHTRVAGTYGYMAPEYAMRGQLSVKADVYSFGVLLLEIVTGRKNTDSNLPLEAQNILEWIWRLYKRGQILDVIDEVVVRSCPEEQALRCIHVGLLCTQADSAARPQISDVILMISRDSVTLADPTTPAFVNVSHSHISKSNSTYEDSQRDELSGASATTSSSASSKSPLVASFVNDASISEMGPR